MEVDLSIQLDCRSNAYKQFVFHLVVFAETVSMPCVHISHLKLNVNRKFSAHFSLGGMNE